MDPAAPVPRHAPPADRSHRGQRRDRLPGRGTRLAVRAGHHPRRRHRRRRQPRETAEGSDRRPARRLRRGSVRRPGGTADRAGHSQPEGVGRPLGERAGAGRRSRDRGRRPAARTRIPAQEGRLCGTRHGPDGRGRNRKGTGPRGARQALELGLGQGPARGKGDRADALGACRSQLVLASEQHPGGDRDSPGGGGGRPALRPERLLGGARHPVDPA